MTSMAAADPMKYLVHRLLEPSSMCGEYTPPTEIKYIIQLSFLVFVIPRETCDSVITLPERKQFANTERLKRKPTEVGSKDR